MIELCYFSLEQWEIRIHLLWGKSFNIPLHCDPHLNQTKWLIFNDLLPLTIPGVLKLIFDVLCPNPWAIWRFVELVNQSANHSRPKCWIFFCELTTLICRKPNYTYWEQDWFSVISAESLIFLATSLVQIFVNHLYFRYIQGVLKKVTKGKKS